MPAGVLFSRPALALVVLNSNGHEHWHSMHHWAFKRALQPLQALQQPSRCDGHVVEEELHAGVVGE